MYVVWKHCLLCAISSRKVWGSQHYVAIALKWPNILFREMCACKFVVEIANHPRVLYFEEQATKNETICVVLKVVLVARCMQFTIERMN